MSHNAFRIHGTGCGLGDWIYGHIDFHSPRVRPYHSRAAGDGGLEMGKVVFRDDIVRFAGRPWDEILRDIADGASPDAFNAGGPALASLTLAAQLLRARRVPVAYYGLLGEQGDGNEDETASRLRSLLAQTPLDLTRCASSPGHTTCAHAFSDPKARNGRGERFFVYDSGVAADFDPSFLGEGFFQSTFNLYAATALTPKLHKQLPWLLEKSRRRGALTVVGAVFDFAAEKAAPGAAWTLGEGNGYSHIDLLVGDEVEMCRLAGIPEAVTDGSAGAATVERAVEMLLDKGLTAAVVTRGSEPVYYRSLGGIFGTCRGSVPALAALTDKSGDREAHPGDTVGAGDNFLGALLADFMEQILADDSFSKGEVHVDREALYVKPLRLRPAVEFAAAAGGLACLQYGGVRLEAYPGENMERIREFAPEPQPVKPWGLGARRP